MKNVGVLLRHDLRLATRNVIAVMVLFGVAVIPSFFGWFNVLSSWDPFGNLKDLKVAVANSDAGFKSELFPIRVNIGEQVIASLRANSDLEWVFTSEQEAIEGTKSEEYYAALVLPPDFSQNMMTFLAPDAKSAEIVYYTNEKTNALSPKVTGEAATEVSTQINESFTKTLNEVGLSVVSSLATELEKPDTRATLERFESNLGELATQLRSSSETARMFSSLIASSKPLVTSAASLTDSSVVALRETTGAISNGANAVSSVGSTLQSATGSLSSALSASAGNHQELANQVDRLYASLGQQTTQVKATLTTIADAADEQIAQYTTLRNGLQAQAQATSDPVLREGLQLVADQLTGVIERQTALRDRINLAVTELDRGISESQATQQEIKALIDQARQAIQGAANVYNDSLKPKLEQLGDTLSSINNSFAAIGNDIVAAASSLSGGSGSLVGALTIAQDLTATLARNLDSTATQFDTVAGELQRARASGDVSKVRDLIGSNPEILASELTTPVALKTIPVFKVDTFGAQMAPFYTVLGLWVGALLLSVLIRVKVARELLPPLAKPLTLTQEYIGRYGIFALLGFLQSSLLYVGLIGFVGVRPAHPFLLILVGWVMSTVFTLITYTLVVSFGEAGKALAVVLLVFQISAGGGAYPLSLLPHWFQNISPFLPVSHATNAVRAAIAGIYQGDYWQHLGALALFIVPTLLLGLLLRRPLIGLNRDLDKALESTKLM